MAAQDLQEQLVHKEQRELQDPQEIKDHKDLLGQREQLEHRVTEGWMERRVLQDQQDLQDLLEHLETKVALDQVEA